MQAYSEPKRASEPTALPDVEILRGEDFKIFAPGYSGECEECGADSTLADGFGAEENLCITCAKERYGKGWFWRSCFPGCLPDSDPFGPFATREEALADAQSNTEGEE